MTIDTRALALPWRFTADAASTFQIEFFTDPALETPADVSAGVWSAVVLADAGDALGDALLTVPVEDADAATGTLVLALTEAETGGLPRRARWVLNRTIDSQLYTVLAGPTDADLMGDGGDVQANTLPVQIVDNVIVQVGPAYLGTITVTGSSGGATELSDLTDVGDSTPTNRNALMADGDSWESRPIVEADVSDLGTYATDAALTAHTGDVTNPHSVTKTQVGLGNVDNTADTAKPVSTDQAAADDAHQAAAEATAQAALDAHTSAAVDAHDASAISVADAGALLDATNAEAAFAELASEAATDAQNLTDHENASNPHSLDAADVGADPAGTAAVVQSNLDTHEGTTTGNPHGVTAADIGVEAGATADQTAAEVPIADSGDNFTGTDVEAALAELAGSAGTDDQTASEVPITDAAGNYTSTDVEGALAEAADDTAAVQSNLDDHEGEATGAHAASAISVNPAGLAVVTDTDVQGAIAELDAGVDAASSGGATQLSQLTDVSAAADTGNFVLATPDGTTGDYSGRALVDGDIPAAITRDSELGTLAAQNSVDLTSDVTGDLPVADGGTGASTAAGARTNLDVDQAGTDNSTDVTLAGTPDYLTIVGQTITRNPIDLAADVTGDLPVADGGTGASTAAAARTNLDVYSTGEADAAFDAAGSAAAVASDLADHETETTAAHAASAISVADAGTHFTGTELEAVTQEIGAALAAISDTDDQTAAEVPITDAAGNFTGTDVEAALAEAADDTAAVASDLSDHEGETTGAHAASAISVADTGDNFTGTDVEAVLAELAGGAGTDDQTAAEVPITDAGGYYTGTDVEAALQEAGASIDGLGALSVQDTVGTTDIDDEAVTLAKLQHIATDSFVGRDTAGTGDPEVLDAATARGILNVEDGATADQTAAEILAALLTVDGTGTGLDADLVDGNEASALLDRANHTGTQNLATISDSGALAAKDTVATGDIDDDAVTYAKLQDVSATDRLLGRDTAGAGVVEELAPAAVRTMLNVEDGADVTDAANVAAAGATMDADTDLTGTSWMLDEDNMVSDDATKVPSQQSVKAYVDAASGLTLSDDETLVDESTTQAPTERATKLYVDAEVQDAFNGATDYIGIARERIQMHDHFFGVGNANTQIGALGWSAQTTGTGAQIGHFLGWDASRTVETGTTSTGLCHLHLGRAALEGTPTGSVLWRISTNANLSTVSEEYLVRVGLLNGDMDTGFFFRYDRLGDGVNWHAVCSHQATETATDTGVSFDAATTYELLIVMDGANAVFYIDQTQVATINTNLPQSGVSVGDFWGPGAAIVKSAGTTNRTFTVLRFALDLEDSTN